MTRGEIEKVNIGYVHTPDWVEYQKYLFYFSSPFSVTPSQLIAWVFQARNNTKKFLSTRLDRQLSSKSLLY